MGLSNLFKKKVNPEEEQWREEITKEALKDARVDATPILKNKIKQEEVDRLTGAKKGKLMEKLSKEFKPLGDMASKEKMDRLLGKSSSTTNSNIDRMLGRDRPVVHVIQQKGENFRKIMGHDEIRADGDVKEAGRAGSY
jgi:hypothetical protein